MRYLTYVYVVVVAVVAIFQLFSYPVLCAITIVYLPNFLFAEF